MRWAPIMKQDRFCHLTLGLLAAATLACGSDPVSNNTNNNGNNNVRPPPISPNEAGWWRGTVAYEVFVRSFADSDGDGIGDLKGLTERLDYLNDGDANTRDDLGIDALWLMPIYPSPSYHGYDITDYKSVHADYGTMADFEAFVQAAHQRGIRVILDFVVNHSSELHPWFLSAQEGPQAEFRNYYNWKDEDPGWRRSWDRRKVWYEKNGSYYYGLFGDDIPDLNLADPAVEEEILSTMQFWATKGVDGFRIDAARHLFESATGDLADQPETHAFIQRIREKLHADHPQVLLLAEAWINVETLKAYYGDGYEYQMAFSFDVAAGIKDAVASASTESLHSVLERSAAAYPDRGFEAPFLSNHDQDRVMRTVGRLPKNGRLSAATLMAMPGTPFLYYGEELGMAGGSTPFDEDKRQPFRWTDELPGVGFSSAEPWYRSTEDVGVDLAAQRGVQGSMWSLYRDLIRIRQDSPALGDGDQTLVTTTGGDSVMAWTRQKDGERVLFVANFSDSSAAEFSVDVSGTAELLLAEGVATASVSGAGPVVLQGLPSKGFALFRLSP